MSAAPPPDRHTLTDREAIRARMAEDIATLGGSPLFAELRARGWTHAQIAGHFLAASERAAVAAACAAMDPLKAKETR